MDMFWNKWLSILKFPYIYVTMFPKFFYTHTYKSQVLQRFLGFIILKTIIKFVQYSLRIFAGFIHSGILLLWSNWWNLKRRGSVRRRLQRMNMWRRTLLRGLFGWLILKRRGSVSRFQRVNMWRRMLLRSLFSWLILKRRGSVSRFQRMKMWRRTLLRS
jgi:hypothetical protein